MQEREANPLDADSPRRPGGPRRGHPGSFLCLFLLAILAAAGCSRSGPSAWQGYIEGEFVYVSSPLSGRLDTLSVAKGARVAAGAPLFALERASESDSLRQASQQLDAAKAQLEDLGKGSRPEEIAALEARLGQARAAAELSRLELVRQDALYSAAATSASDHDRARLTHEADARIVEEVSAQLETARLGGRPDAVEASGAAMRAAGDAEARAQWGVDQKAQAAPVAALVYDTLYREGEYVSAGSPVVSLLPPGNLKVRFFVPEPDFARIKAGDRLSVVVEGLPSPLAGHRELPFAAARIHAPRALQPRQPREAGLHGGGRLRRRGRRRPPPGPARRHRAAGPMSGDGEFAIDVTGVTKRFGDKTVVNAIDLQVRRGEIYGFLGPNGSGKTTFIRMLCGLLTPDGGSGTCLGHDILTAQALIKCEVGYMTQRFSYYEDLSIVENLDFTRGSTTCRTARRRSAAASSASASPTAGPSWPASYPGDGSSASRSPRACSTSPSSCSWMSRPPAWTPRPGASSGTRSTASRPRGSRSSSPPTTWTRPSAATGSRS